MKVMVSALAVLVFASCAGSSSEKEYVSPTAATAPVTVADSVQKKNADGIEQILGANAAKPTAMQVPLNVPAATTQPVAAPAAVTAAPTAAGMNPAHGQPGHRCEIAVGAPLSTAPAAKPAAQPTAQPIAVNQITPTMVPTPAPAAPTAKGMNPPHGQPGHRCEIAVGAPLNSKPVTAKPAAATQTIQPAIAQQPAPVTPAAPGMNPAHGQPGHRCDIGVGAPLNSAPAKKDSSR
jgi:hypothetical protein